MSCHVLPNLPNIWPKSAKTANLAEAHKTLSKRCQHRPRIVRIGRMFAKVGERVRAEYRLHCWATAGQLLNMSRGSPGASFLNRALQGRRHDKTRARIKNGQLGDGARIQCGKSGDTSWRATRWQHVWARVEVTQLVAQDGRITELRPLFRLNRCSRRSRRSRCNCPSIRARRTRRHSPTFNARRRDPVFSPKDIELDALVIVGNFWRNVRHFCSCVDFLQYGAHPRGNACLSFGLAELSKLIKAVVVELHL